MTEDLKPYWRRQVFLELEKWLKSEKAAFYVHFCRVAGPEFASENECVNLYTHAGNGMQVLENMQQVAQKTAQGVDFETVLPEVFGWLDEAPCWDDNPEIHAAFQQLQIEMRSTKDEATYKALNFKLFHMACTLVCDTMAHQDVISDGSLFVFDTLQDRLLAVINGKQDNLKAPKLCDTDMTDEHKIYASFVMYCRQAMANMDILSSFAVAATPESHAQETLIEYHAHIYDMMAEHLQGELENGSFIIYAAGAANDIMPEYFDALGAGETIPEFSKNRLIHGFVREYLQFQFGLAPYPPCSEDEKQNMDPVFMGMLIRIASNIVDAFPVNDGYTQPQTMETLLQQISDTYAAKSIEQIPTIKRKQGTITPPA